MYGEFGDMKFKDNSHLQQAIDCVYQCLYDSDLPVRVMAATSIHKLINNPTVFQFLKPALKNILEVYLKMMTEIESEELVSALEEIVKHFKDDIEPYAIELCNQLVVSYQRLIQVNVEEDDGESALAAVGCVTAIRRILDSVSTNAPLLQKLEEIVFPILMHSLTMDGLDAIEDGLDCIALFVYYSTKGNITANLWKLYPQLLYIVVGEETEKEGGFAFEYLAQISVSLQNFVAKDPEGFLRGIHEQSGQTYILLMFNFLKRVF